MKSGAVLFAGAVAVTVAVQLYFILHHQSPVAGGALILTVAVSLGLVSLVQYLVVTYRSRKKKK